MVDSTIRSESAVEIFNQMANKVAARARPTHVFIMSTNSSLSFRELGWDTTPQQDSLS